MKDVATKKPLRVSTDGTTGPYIMVPVEMLDEVRKLLTSRHISFSVDENAVSLDEAPVIAVVNLGRGGDAKAVQAILDQTN